MRKFRKLTAYLIVFIMFVTNLNMINAQENNLDEQEEVTQMESAEEQNVYYNLETDLKINKEVVNSGDKNNVNILIKTTGVKAKFTDVKVKLTFANFIEIDEDNLDEVIVGKFDSYTLDDNELVLQAGVLETGKFYDLPIIFTPKNGYFKDGEEVDFKLNFVSNEVNESSGLEIPQVSQKLTIEASSPFNVEASFLGVKNENEIGGKALAPGSLGLWQTKARINKAETGQMYIKETSKIIIRQKYNENFLYKGIHKGPQPTSVDESGRELIWEIDPPSYVDQENLVDNLFFEEIIVIYEVKDMTVDEKTEIEGINVDFEFTNIADNLAEKNASAKTDLYPINTESPDLYGYWWVPGHTGPIDAFDNYQKNSNFLDTQPTVYPWARLKFAHQITPLYYGQEYAYDEYKFNYYIDDYLVLEEIKAPGKFTYYPNWEYGSPTDLAEQPEITLNVFDEFDNILFTKNKIGQDEIFTREVMGIDRDTRIAKTQFEFTKSQVGMAVTNFGLAATGLSQMPTYSFSIAENWADSPNIEDGKVKVSNNMDIQTKVRTNQEGVLTEEYIFRENIVDGDKQVDWIVKYEDGTVKQKYDNESLGISGPRSAFVVEEPEAYTPTVTNTIALRDHNKSYVYKGDNMLVVRVNNDSSSVGSIKDGMVSYFVLPNSIYIPGENLVGGLELLDNSYHGDNSLYKITWEEKDYPPNESIELEVPVRVSDIYQDITLHVYTHLLNNDNFNTLKVKKPTIQDTIIVKDKDDINGNQNTEELMLKSSNAYGVYRYSYIETQKTVKGSLDTDFKDAGKMKVDGRTQFKLNIKNRKGEPITSFALMDTLPTIGDLGITDLVPRNSEFNLVLTGPIILEQEDEGKFLVGYSKSSQPKRDVLNDILNTGDFHNIEDPITAEDPEWMFEEDVEDWNEIRSFAILLGGRQPVRIAKRFEINEELNIIFETKIPTGDQEALTTKLATLGQDESLTAWNSFAIAANGQAIIEPRQVGVSLLGTKPIPVDPGPVDPGPRPGGGGSSEAEEVVIIDDEKVPLGLPDKLNVEDHFRYIVGYPDNTMRPEGYITRDEVATIFFRLLNPSYRESVRSRSHKFPDVEKGRWSEQPIATLAKAKIIGGYEDGSFRPGNYITRAELAAIASRFDNLSPVTKDKFSDIKGHWANVAINSASEKGWVNGYEDGTFRPDRYITRAEFVALVNNVLDRRVKEENILPEARQYPDLIKGKWYYETMQEAINSHHYEREKMSDFEVWTEIYYPDVEM